MTASDVIGRIQEIKTALSQMSNPIPVPTTAAAPAAATNTAAADSFATILSAVAPAAAAAAAVPATSAASVTAVAASGTAASGGGIDFEAVSAKYVGLPYIWGGNDPSAGLDCSSFVQNVYKDLGYDLPRTTYDQINQGTPVASMADARPGDLLFSHDGGHVAMYLGNGKVIDAPQPGTTIQVRDAWENDGNITAIRRIIPETVQNTAAAAPAAGDLAAAAQAAFLSGASL